MKVGADAEQFGVVDVWWTADGSLCSSVQLVPATTFQAEPAADAFVARKNRFMEESMSVSLTKLPIACSSKRVRYEESGLAKFLLDLAKRGFRRQGVEVVLTQGGNVRGKADYEPGEFTLGNLFAEFYFPMEMAVVELPGQVIAEAIRFSRSAEGEKPGFLHADSGVEVSEEHVVLKIDGRPFEAGRTYVVALPNVLLKGMDNVAPLVAYAGENLQCPEDEACLPIKQVICDVCAKDAWRELCGLDQWEHGALAHVDLKAAVLAHIKEMDTSGDGTLSEEELRQGAAKRGLSSGLVPQMMRALDVNHDGRVSHDEILALVH